MKTILLFVVLICSATPLSAKTYGLVVGINDYKHYPSLSGAVNDANDIAAALQNMGAEKVIKLLNTRADYRTISSSWKQLVELADPGDTIVFSYAGHGGREPERIPGSEDDHMDESFILGDFNPIGPSNGERIIDNEINDWLKSADKVSIVFVADSCYSGTMERSIDSRAEGLGSREVGYYGSPADDRHPPPSTSASQLEPSNLPHVMFFASSEEDKLTPELLIDGRPRGALSWAFANALRGAANVDNNINLTRQEMVSYIEENTRMASENRQTPTYFPRGHGEKVLFSSSLTADKQFTETILKVKILSGGRQDNGLINSLSGVSAATHEGGADLIWDRDSNQVISGFGDVVTEQCGPNVADFQRVVDKWRLLHVVKQMSARNGLQFRLGGGGKLYQENEETSFAISGRKYSYFTLFAVGPDGNFGLVYPIQNNNGGDPLSLPPGTSFGFDLVFTPPFGAEHLIGFATDKPLTDLHGMLADGQGSYASLIAMMRRFNSGGAIQAGVTGVYSSPKK